MTESTQEPTVEKRPDEPGEDEPAETPAQADEHAEAFGDDDAIPAAQYGPAGDFGDG